MTEQAPSALTSYSGSCHCGAVRFEARLDLRAGVGKCNCTICKKTNFVGARVRLDDFMATAGDEARTEYLYGSRSVRRSFCSRCGVQTFAHVNVPQAGGEFYTVNAHCLDGADLAGVPVRYCDGLHDNWWNETPAFP